MESALATQTVDIPKELANGVVIVFDREDDGRWIAEVPDFPGVLAYGATQEAAANAALALALHVVADRVEHGESPQL